MGGAWCPQDICSRDLQGGGAAVRPSLEGVKVGREPQELARRAWCVDKRADVFKGTCVGSLCLLVCRGSVGCICVCVCVCCVPAHAHVQAAVD